MGEPSPKLLHLNFELRDYIPPAPRSSSSNTYRSTHSTVEDSDTDRLLPDFRMDETSHPSPFFSNSELNTFNPRPGDERTNSLEFNLALEGPPALFLTHSQTTFQPNDPTVTTPNGDDTRKSTFDSIQDTSQHSLRGDEGQLCPALVRPSLPSISKVRDYCIMNMPNRMK